MPILILNLPAYASSLAKITELTDLPILQDNEEEEVAKQYGASKWYLYVINPEGKPHLIHYDLPMPSQLDRLDTWIAEAKGGTQ